LSVSIPEWPRVDLSDMPAVMTAKQVGPFFNKSPEQLANERHLKKGLPYTKIGARVFYLRSDIEAYLAANRVGGEA
jgi:hypothetical protein